MNRIKWMDVLKGMGGIFVVIGHLHPGGLILKYIYTFHMFLFLFASGYLYRYRPERKFTDVLKRKSKSLLLPFAAGNGAAILLYLSMGRYDLTEAIQRFTFSIGKISWNSPVWFLLILWEAEMLYELYHRYASNIPKWILGLTAAGIGYFVQGIHFPFGLTVLPIAFTVYMIGHIFREHGWVEWMLANPMRKKRAFYICMAVNLIVGMILNGKVCVYHGVYPNYLYSYIAGIAGTLAYIIIADHLQNSRMLTYWGRNSLFLLCSQYWVFKVFHEYSVKYINYSLWREDSAIKAMIMTVVSMTVIWGLISMKDRIKNAADVMRSRTKAGRGIVYQRRRIRSSRI